MSDAIFTLIGEVVFVSELLAAATLELMCCQTIRWWRHGGGSKIPGCGTLSGHGECWCWLPRHDASLSFILRAHQGCLNLCPLYELAHRASFWRHSRCKHGVNYYFMLVFAKFTAVKERARTSSSRSLARPTCCRWQTSFRWSSTASASCYAIGASDSPGSMGCFWRDYWHRSCC